MDFTIRGQVVLSTLKPSSYIAGTLLHFLGGLCVRYLADASHTFAGLQVSSITTASYGSAPQITAFRILGTAHGFR